MALYLQQVYTNTIPAATLHYNNFSSFDYNYRGRNKCAILNQSDFGANAQNLCGALFYMTSVNKASCSTLFVASVSRNPNKLASDYNLETIS